MEAMASGCAIVSTNNCMIPEIIQHGENGLLADTADELRASCQYLLNNPDESRRLGQNAQDTIKEKYNLERFVHNWNELFFGTIDNYRK
jgi:glycosyltransferase involved in cell wall biosynthesis